MVIFLILLLIAVILHIFALFLSDFAFYGLNLNYNTNSLIGKKTKTEYKQNTKTNLYRALKITLKNKNFIYSNKIINENIDALFSLAKLVDQNTKLNPQKYRARNGEILIDTLAKFAVSKIVTNQKAILFSVIKQECRRLKINKKELGFLKILITKYLLVVLIKNYHFTSRLHQTIKKFSKTKNYKLKSASKVTSYAILKFNKNSSKFDGLDANIYPILNRLCYMRNINKLIILYLKALYN